MADCGLLNIPLEWESVDSSIDSSTDAQNRLDGGRGSSESLHNHGRFTGSSSKIFSRFDDEIDKYFLFFTKWLMFSKLLVISADWGRRRNGERVLLLKLEAEPGRNVGYLIAAVLGLFRVTKFICGE